MAQSAKRRRILFEQLVASDEAFEAYMNDSDNNVDARAQDDGNTLLHHVMANRPLNARQIAWLIEKKANPRKLNHAGNDPLHHALVAYAKRGGEVDKPMAHAAETFFDAFDVDGTRRGHADDWDKLDNALVRRAARCGPRTLAAVLEQFPDVSPFEHVDGGPIVAGVLKHYQMRYLRDSAKAEGFLEDMNAVPLLIEEYDLVPPCPTFD